MNKLIGFYNYIVTKLSILTNDNPSLLDIDYIKGFGDYIDKYKWHDIQENPDDLPPLLEDVVVCKEEYDGEIVYTMACKVDQEIIENSYVFNGWSCGGKVLAWRNMEPFEEE